MDVSTETLQAFLDDAWETSGAGNGIPNSFLPALTGTAQTIDSSTGSFTTASPHGLANGSFVKVTTVLPYLNATSPIVVTSPTVFLYTANIGVGFGADANAKAAPVVSLIVPVLRNQLRTYEKSVTKLFRGGSIASVSKNSASQAYRGPGLGSYTPVQIANAWRTLINFFDQTKARIDAALEQNPAQTLNGTVSTSGQGSAIFTGSASTWQQGQIVTVLGGIDDYFNLAGTVITTVLSSASFTYAIKATGLAGGSEAAFVRYSTHPCLAPDSSDGSVYNEMKRHLVVVTDASSDVINLRLQPTLAPPGALNAW